MTLRLPAKAASEALLSVITTSGSGFVDLADGRQAFVLPTLIRRMALNPGDRLLCQLVPNFPDRISDRVPWRVIHASVLERGAGGGVPLDDVVVRVLSRMEDSGGAWTTAELSAQLGTLEERFVLDALYGLEERGQVSVARLQRRRPDGGRDVETYWAAAHDALLPVGLFEDEDEDEDDDDA